MIPLFPEFKSLEIADKDEFEKVTQLFPPYSDFNFVSLWSWNTEQKTEISNLHGNLLVKFQDYITNKPFYSFIGTNRIDDTIHKIISHARQKKINTTLRLIPEHVINKIANPNVFDIQEDQDNFDYILSIPDLIDLKGKKLRGKKNFINRFHNNYGDQITIKHLDFANEDTKKSVLELFLTWEKERGKSRDETQNELEAIKRILETSQLKLQNIGIYVQSKIVGFSINEVVWDGYSIIHFEKAAISYTGAFQYLKQQSAIDLQSQGCKYINYEQDLGIEGLRKAKEAYQPIYYLKKYSISKLT